MISRWKWMLKQTFKKLWFRATLFAIVAIITALLSILFKSMIPESVSVKVGAEAVDNILNILASSMLAVTTFSLSIMVTAYGSATTNVTPRATRLVVEDVTTQNVLATFIGSFLFSLVGIIALNMGAYGERGRVILFIVTLVVIALILITLLRWIQHLTSLGRVGETTAKVEQAAIETFIARARNPCLGGYPWLENNEQPKGTVAVYPKKIGYVESSSRMYNFDMRKKGFQKVMSENNLMIQPEHTFQMSPTDVSVQEAFKQSILNLKGNLPTALFCECDYMAISVIKTLNELNINVPEDISVIGFDNIAESQIISPELTTIHVKKDKISSLAVEKLIREIDHNEDDKMKIFVDTELIIRKSCCSPNEK